MVFDDVAHVVEAQPVFRHDVTQLALVVRLPGRDRALEIRQVFLRGVDRGELVLHQDVDTPFGTWNDIGPTSSGV